MPRRSSQTTVWGYLLPLIDGLPSLELRGADATLGTDVSCSLRLPEASLKALGPKGSVGVTKEHCRLRRAVEGEPGPARLRVDSRKALCWVDGRQVKHGSDAPLPNGARIAISLRELVAFVFVDCTTSDNFGAPKELLDRYLVAHRLGEGGFGQVYLLFCKKKFKPYALKVNEMDTEMRRRFASREAQILRNMNHPCVIKTELTVLSPKQLYLVMEFMPGGDLSQYVNSLRLLTEAQTKLIFFQLALAVSYLHEQSICHRDLKPANILLQRRDPHTLIKVTDFGLAKGEAMHSAMTTVAGTELYLAPEVMTERTYTKQVDVWSMGVLLYYSLSGALPFPHGMSEAIRAHHQVQYPPASWRGVSMSALELVRRMLQVTVERRASVQGVLGSSWLQDDAMREKAYQLTKLKEVRPLPAAPPTGLSPAAAPPPSPRVLLPPRGVLQHMDSGGHRDAAARVTPPARASPSPGAFQARLAQGATKKEVVPPAGAQKKPAAGVGAAPKRAVGVPAGYASPRPGATPVRYGASPKASADTPRRGADAGKLGTASPRGSGDVGRLAAPPRGYAAGTPRGVGAIAALGAAGMGTPSRGSARTPGVGGNGLLRGAATQRQTPGAARVGQVASDPLRRATPASPAVHAVRTPLPGLVPTAHSPAGPKTIIANARLQLKHVPPRDP